MIPQIKNLPDHHLSTAVMVVSALMIVLGTVTIPGEGSSIWVMGIWLATSLVLMSVFLMSFYELVRRCCKEE